MTVQDKKKIILVVLVVFLAGYWVVELFVGTGNHAPAPASVAGTGAAKKGQQGPPNMAINVDIGLLERPRPAYKAAKNIFAPVYAKPVLVKQPKPAPGAKPGETVTVTPLPPLPPPPPPKPQSEIDAENAREEMQKIRVLGFLKRKGRTDVFVSLGNDNFVVPRGGKIIKGYYVADIGKDFVLLSDKNTGVEVRVNTEQPKGGSKTVPSPGVQGGGAVPPGRMPLPGGQPNGPRHFDPSQGFPGGVGVVPVAPQVMGQPEPLKNYSGR